MKVMTTLSTAIAFASLALAGSDALAQSESARKQASGQSATHATPAAPHTDVDQPGVAGTQGANSGTNTSAGPEGASIRPTNQGAAEAGMADSTMDKEMKSGSKAGQGQSQHQKQGATTGSSNSSQKSGYSQTSGSGATSASGATGAAGNSARAGGGMDDPARTADRSGVTGAPDEIEREQRDIERPSE